MPTSIKAAQARGTRDLARKKLKKQAEESMLIGAA
jgi:hypothetical protein